MSDSGLFQKHYTELEQIFTSGQGESLLKPLQQLLRKNSNQLIHAAQVRYLLALWYWQHHHFKTAYRHIRICLAHLPTSHPNFIYALLLSGDIQNSLGNYASGLKIFWRVLQEAILKDNIATMAHAYLGIGEFYLINNENQRALTCQRNAYALAIKNNDINLTLKSATFLLESLSKQSTDNETSEVLEYCKNLCNTHKTSAAILAELQHYTGIFYLKNKNIAEAYDALNQSLLINQQENLLWGQTQNRIALAQVLTQQGQLQKAAAMLESTILIASSFDHGYLQKIICKQLCEIRQKEENYAAALIAHETYHRLSLDHQNRIKKNLNQLNKKQLIELDEKHELIKLQVMQKQLQSEVRNLQDQCNRIDFDILTQLPNRRKLEKTPLTSKWIYIFCIKNLEHINQKAGFLVGDQIIKLCSDLIKQILSKSANTNTKCYRHSGTQIIIFSHEDKSLNFVSLFNKEFKSTSITLNPIFELISHSIESIEQIESIAHTVSPCWHYPPDLGGYDAEP